MVPMSRPKTRTTITLLLLLSALAPQLAPATYETTEQAQNIEVSTWSVPASEYPRLHSARTITNAFNSHLATEVSPDGAGELSNGDIVLHKIVLSGTATSLLDRLADQRQGNPTANFQALIREDGIDLSYLGPGVAHPELVLSETIQRGAFRVVPDRRNDTLYLLVHIDHAIIDPPGPRDPTAEGWDYGLHRFILELTPESGLVENSIEADSSYDVIPRDVSFSSSTTGLIHLDAAKDQVLEVDTRITPGSKLTVVLQPLGADTDPLTSTATVSQDGNVIFRLNLSNSPKNALYRVVVPGLAPWPSNTTSFVVIGNASGAVVDVHDPECGCASLDDIAVTTTHGGFVVVRNSTGGVVGVSEYLAPGVASPRPNLEPPADTGDTLTVQVFRDTNGNQRFDAPDEQYRVNGTIVQDTTTIGQDSPQTPTETPTPIPTPEWTPTPTPAPINATAETSTTDSATPSPEISTGDSVSTQDSSPTTVWTVSETPDRTTQPTESVSSPGFDVITSLLSLAILALFIRNGRS